MQVTVMTNDYLILRLLNTIYTINLYYNINYE